MRAISTDEETTLTPRMISEPHSPLPWRQDDLAVYSERTAKVVLDNSSASLQDRRLIVRAVNHADKLAETLRRAERELEQGVMSGVVAQHIRQDLAAYEAAQ